MVPWLLACATPWLALISGWCLIGATPRGQPWTPAVNILPGMNAGASTYAVPSPIKGSGTAWVLLGSWALSPARPTPIHPRHECRGLSALFGDSRIVIFHEHSVILDRHAKIGIDALKLCLAPLGHLCSNVF